MQTIAITITDDHWVKLQQMATHLDISPETLIVIGIEQVLTHTPSSTSASQPQSQQSLPEHPQNFPQILTELNQAFARLNSEMDKRKQAEAEILHALAKEKQRGHLKSQVLSITSHEFRTPLTTILSTAELLEHYQWTKAEQVEQLHLIQETVQQMLQLLENMQFVGMADVAQLPFTPTPVELHDFCQRLVTQIQQGLTIKHLTDDENQTYTLAFVSQVTCLPAMMDEKLLRQILSNLLSNAIKYSPVGGTIRFNLACEGENACFEIQDQGIGIPLEDIPHLFDFFYRGKNVGAIAGTGLGLAIVKQCVDLHQGQITVTSEVGVGTTFTVRLPLIGDRGSKIRIQGTANRE
ncbi:MAG: HAMP domain-containing sensor histidine kinase [Coleofasciculus sp. G1-WW12-02]|uniref:sensor histidine kinase n=1 Tax=Coleofasciculus sp. G1-WW12-02 TaxID=3068483 RepID=UPI0032FB2CE6